MEGVLDTGVARGSFPKQQPNMTRNSGALNNGGRGGLGAHYKDSMGRPN